MRVKRTFGKKNGVEDTHFDIVHPKAGLLHLRETEDGFEIMAVDGSIAIYPSGGVNVVGIGITSRIARLTPAKDG